MTAFGFATICFSICLIVALLFQVQIGMRKEFLEIEPFPKVILNSPFHKSLLALRKRLDLLMEIRQLPTGNFSISFGSGELATVKLERLAEYDRLLSLEESEKTLEKRFEVEIAGSRKVVRAMFEKDGISILYSASIILTENGQLLTSHLDVARLLMQVLNGESQRVNVKDSKEEYVQSLKDLALRYGIEVLETR